MNYIVIVIVVIGVLLLALMASQIDIEIEPQQINPIPKLKIRFRKDSSLYSFLKSSNSNLKDNIKEENEPYKNTLMIGEAYINYGDEEATLAKCEVTLKANNPFDEYHYFSADPSTRFKRIDGFLERDKSFKAIKDFRSWDGTAGNGLFFNLHRITLPIKKLYIGQMIKLKYNLQIYIHYREVTKDAEITYHAYFFRCLNSTENGVFKYILPKGKQSKIIRFDIINEFNNKEILNYELEVKEGIYNLPGDYGVIWISTTEDSISLQWSTTRKSPRGTLHKLKWYTEALS